MFENVKNMFSLEKWIENFEGYMEAKIELIKFDINDKLVSIFTKILLSSGFFLFGIFGMFFLNFGVAELLNHFFGYSFAGFFILALFYFILALVFYFFKGNQNWMMKIESLVRNSLDHPKAGNNDESTS